MTLQEIYEQIRTHFTLPDAVLASSHNRDIADYNAQVSDEGLYGAVYRFKGDPDSLVRCPVGVAIPDRLYSRALEGRSLRSALDDRPAVWEGVFEYFEEVLTADAWDFLEAVQVDHDMHCKTVAAFVEKLDERAGEYGLNVVTS